MTSLTCNDLWNGAKRAVNNCLNDGELSWKAMTDGLKYAGEPRRKIIGAVSCLIISAALIITTIVIGIIFPFGMAIIVPLTIANLISTISMIALIKDLGHNHGIPLDDIFHIFGGIVQGRY